jgi:hypothetical protein
MRPARTRSSTGGHCCAMHRASAQCWSLRQEPPAGTRRRPPGATGASQFIGLLAAPELGPRITLRSHPSMHRSAAQTPRSALASRWLRRSDARGVGLLDLDDAEVADPSQPPHESHLCALGGSISGTAADTTIRTRASSSAASAWRGGRYCGSPCGPPTCPDPARRRCRSARP